MDKDEGMRVVTLARRLGLRGVKLAGKGEDCRVLIDPNPRRGSGGGLLTVDDGLAGFERWLTRWCPELLVTEVEVA